MKPLKRKPLTEEMLLDLSQMGDVEFCKKWNTSRQYPIRKRKLLGIKSFNNQHGTVEHKFDGNVEYKYCQKGHWKPIQEFGKNKTRWDGLRGWCRECERLNRLEMYDKNDGAAKVRRWVQTETGRKSKSATMRKVWAKRRGNYIKFDLQDEERIYDLCNHSCAYCKVPITFDELEFDHFIPVNSGGMTEPKNMLPSCYICNRGRGGKFDKEPHEWLTQKFGPVYGEQIYNECVSILEKLK